MPYVETPDELADHLADLLGVYEDPLCESRRSVTGGVGANDHIDHCDCRVFWVPWMAQRIRRAGANEEHITKGMPMTTQVRFSDVHEFIRELEQDAETIDREIVRLTCTWTPTATVPPSHLSVMATYTRDGQLVKLDHFCGQVWRVEGDHRDPTTEQTLERAWRVEDQVRAACEAQLLEVRAGVLEPTGQEP